MGAYRLIHTFVFDEISQKTERFFRFKNRAKEEAAIIVRAPKLKWEYDKKTNNEICRLSSDDSFLLEPVYFE